VLLLGIASSGCIHHQIGFNVDDTSWHHEVPGHPIPAELFVTIPPGTEEAEIEISSATAGAANVWHARYGEMFVQALKVELAQLARSYTLGTGSDGTGSAQPGAYHLMLDVPAFAYAGFAASTTVSAVLTDPSGNRLLNERYEARGRSDAGKVVGLGAFGMKSAIRQSTLDAYLQIFERLRTDLRAAIEAPVAEAAATEGGS
jgi:hypothetical protein